MYINRQKNGYGWYSKIISKDLNTQAERLGYINFSFKKGCEPNNLENGSLEGDLYFIDKQGNKRKVFPIAKERNGLVYIEFKILEIEKSTAYSYNADDLPF